MNLSAHIFFCVVDDLVHEIQPLYQSHSSATRVALAELQSSMLLPYFINTQRQWIKGERPSHICEAAAAHRLDGSSIYFANPRQHR